MYEYAPKPRRIREKIWMSGCLFSGMLSYGFGQILPYPVFYQLFAVIALTGAVLITVRYLLRDYLYRVEVSENGDSADFIITEQMGRRRDVVCRISVSDIVEMIPVSDFSSRELSEKVKKRTFYRYVSQFQPENAYLLEIFDDEKTYFLEICGDERLIFILSERKKQYLSDI